MQNPGNKTIAIYDQNAGKLAARYEAFTPAKIRSLIQTFFHPASPTVDIGSGSGRDTAFLNSQGYPTIGVEASDGMRAEAERYHPGFTYLKDSLPELSTLESGSFRNLLSNAVLMHLSEADLVKGLLNILRVLEPRGRAVLSFRGPSVPEHDNDRQISLFTPSQVAELLESLGGKVLHLETVVENGVSWHYVVCEKTGLELKDGLSRIQDIITNDTKTATYKLALLRALCDLARTESHTVFWDPAIDHVVVPLERLALSWLRYYWQPIKLGIRQTTKSEVAFAASLRALFEDFSNPRDVILDYESGKPQKKVLAAIRKIADTIDKGPVQYTGGGSTPIFHRRAQVAFHDDDQGRWKGLWYGLGGIKVPANMWRDIRLFHHWIEKSLIMEWVELTKETIDTSQRASRLFEVFSDVDYADRRDTTEIRKLLGDQPLRCVWTGKKVAKFHVDHVIPYALWRNNDYWNLLPACGSVNSSKSMLLPHPDAIRKNGGLILEYWGRYREKLKDKFESQAVKALGMGRAEFSLEDTLEQLMLVSAQLHCSRGVGYFE